MAIPRGYRPVSGSERPPAPGSTVVGPLPADERVGFTVLLRHRPGTPPLHDFEHWDRTSPAERHFLGTDEILAAYGAADEEFEAVAEYFRSRELRVIEGDAGRRRLVVEGPVGQINNALGITLQRYRTPHHFTPRPPLDASERPSRERHSTEQVHRGFDGAVHLPAAVAGMVRAVIGLDNRRLGGPAGVGTGDPPGANSLLPTTLGQLYDFPTSGAAGETIGLFAAADEGAAYLPSDVTAFIAGLPAGFNTPPTVTPIGLTVGLTTYTNNTSVITGGSPPGAAQETTQDVQTAAAIGQGANINVYFTEDSEAGWEAFFQRAVLPLPGDNPPSVLSASWVLYFDDGTGSIGDPTSSGSFSNIISGYLQLAAMRGITALIAIGDWGAANQVTDGSCHVGYPNSDPWFTSCGGTVIGAVSGSTPATFEEFAWSDANTGEGFDLGIYDATGGGVSATFPVPSYQTSAGVNPISQNDGNSRRGVPDVAGMVGITGLVIDGGGYSFTGTSCVAPLYAGLIATINARLGHSVGFLNPTLYRYGPEICNDIIIGNNDSGNTPDAPFYITALGWDPCTGWGSINGRRLMAALAPASVIELAVPAGGEFPATCVGSFSDELLTINNSGFATLLVSGITSSSSEFLAPDVASYPLAVSPGSSIDVVIRFKPTSPGSATSTLTVLSNSLFGPQSVELSGTAPSPRLVLGWAGGFPRTCVGSFADQPLILSNSGRCSLSITDITSSSLAFETPEILSFPIRIAPGTSLAVPIRFRPTGFGLATGTITVDSDDPSGPRSIDVSGTSPTGTLAVTGSTCFGGIRACCSAERTIWINNVGDCKLLVSSVALKRKSRYWKLVNNPFPAVVHPGSSLAVVIRYKAEERCPRSAEIVITSDDPVTPVKTLDLLAYTVWESSGGHRESCGCDRCDPCKSDPCRSDCCDDDCCEDED